MGKEIYLSLVEADWHIAETRKCIDQQKALVEVMKCEKRDASGSQELVALSEGMLRLMLARRKFIEWALSVSAPVGYDSNIQCARDVR